jgi:phospholipid/cholesterol/gamma-HCH transport system permease protein
MKAQLQQTNLAENVITIPKILDRVWIAENELLKSDTTKKVTLDFTSTVRIDSAGMCLIHLLHRNFNDGGGKLILRNLSPGLFESLQSWSSSDIMPDNKIEKISALERIGNTVIKAKDEVVIAFSVLTEMLYWGSFGLLKKRDFRQGILGEQMYQLGFKAFGIVVLLSFLVGVVLALQTAMQLDTYGAGVFLAPLIGITMIREFGPLLTAIILAGRTGSATTAEIATMVVGEELDALKTMGINPVQFVVVPKFWAISVTMPMVSIMATAAGIIGGYLVAIFYLDLASSLYWNELAKSIVLKDLIAGVTKSVVFSWLIIWIGAYYGFKVRGGAEAVGKETTASVVTGIFIIILADALLSFIL